MKRLELSLIDEDIVVVKMETKGCRDGRRRDNAATNTVAIQPNYRQLRYQFRHQKVFSEDEVQYIRDTAPRTV